MHHPSEDHAKPHLTAQQKGLREGLTWAAIGGVLGAAMSRVSRSSMVAQALAWAVDFGVFFGFIGYHKAARNEQAGRADALEKENAQLKEALQEVAGASFVRQLETETKAPSPAHRSL